MTDFQFAIVLIAFVLGGLHALHQRMRIMDDDNPKG